MIKSAEYGISRNVEFLLPICASHHLDESIYLAFIETCKNNHLTLMITISSYFDVNFIKVCTISIEYSENNIEIINYLVDQGINLDIINTNNIINWIVLNIKQKLLILMITIKIIILSVLSSYINNINFYLSVIIEFRN